MEKRNLEKCEVPLTALKDKETGTSIKSDRGRERGWEMEVL